MKFNLETFLNIKKWYFVTGIKKKTLKHCLKMAKKEDDFRQRNTYNIRCTVNKR